MWVRYVLQIQVQPVVVSAGSMKLEGNTRRSRARARKRGWRHTTCQTGKGWQTGKGMFLPHFLKNDYKELAVMSLIFMDCYAACPIKKASFVR